MKVMKSLYNSCAGCGGSVDKSLNYRSGGCVFNAVSCESSSHYAVGLMTQGNVCFYASHFDWFVCVQCESTCLNHAYYLL